MFDTSQAYKDTLSGGLLASDIAGTITLKNGTVVEIREKDIIPGSLKTDNKAVNGSDFAFGGVYLGQLSVTLLKNIDRYSLYDAEVRISYYLQCTDGTTQEIPLGVFYVDEPKRTKKLISLTCYDAMIFFDKKIADITKGFAYDLLMFFTQECGVSFEMTQEEVEKLPNSKIEYTIDPQQVLTYREALSYLASLLGCFATIDRSGCLVLRQFQTEPVETLTAKSRTNSTVSDYWTYFRGIKARFLAESNYYPYSEIGPDSDGLLLDLGDIPIVDQTETVKHQILMDLLEVLKDVRYVPADISTIGNPAVDLGDCLTLENVNNTTDSVLTIVTHNTWTYHRTQNIRSVGSDAKLGNITSPSNKLITQVEGMISKKDVNVYSYTNSGVLHINNREMTTIVIPFVSIEESRPIFMATIPFTMDVDGNVIVRYYMDEALLSEDTLTEYLVGGLHFLTITNNFYIDTARTNRLKITLQTEGFESEKRKNDAKVVSILDYIQQDMDSRTEEGADIVPELKEFAVDDSIPNLTIAKFGIKAVLFGQGLASTVPWDGTLNFADEVGVFTVTPSEFEFGAVSEQFDFELQSPGRSVINDLFAGVPIEPVISFDGFGETIDVSSVIKLYLLETMKYQSYDFDLNNVSHNGIFELNQNHSFASDEEAIDIGRMTSMKIMTSDKQSIETVVIE